MALRRSSVLRQSLDQPKNTLSYLDPDETQETNLEKNGSSIKIPQKFQETAKTEKSVHFATEYESLSEAESTPDSLKTSRDVHTLLPSEHLYSGDTFISETQYLYSGDTFFSETAQATGDSTDPTDPSYATNTFVALESDDETKTASDISHTESFASSTVFSQADSPGQSSSESGTTHREWKDVTDIVKDIDELEESEFVTRHQSFFSEDDEKAEDIEKSTQESLKFIEENQDVEAERAKQKFISQMLAQVQNENTKERIQAHLIKMHPVKWFADFVNGLPKFDENSREILYKYKRRLETEMNKS
ncbi:hypothetical protein ElyMa_005090400 [Elysia marginata]|uniref:BESS domain-containing protein n=1 Tax=Elysia marginata TaxID=1093978 RepID=A0AAV4JJ29_9GAST|nr:hypothetical protein ElyMa_005090400 [Elysia marginata]